MDAAKRVLRTHLEPRVTRFLPVILAEEIKGPAGQQMADHQGTTEPEHSGPTAHNEGVLENWREQRQWELENGIELSTAPDTKPPE